MNKMRKWKGYFLIRRVSGSYHDKPIARSPDYEFSLPRIGIADIEKDWRAADVELCRLWNEQGQPLTGEPGVSALDPLQCLYRTLGTESLVAMGGS